MHHKQQPRGFLHEPQGIKYKIPSWLSHGAGFEGPAGVFAGHGADMMELLEPSKEVSERTGLGRHRRRRIRRPATTDQVLRELSLKARSAPDCCLLCENARKMMLSQTGEAELYESPSR